MRKAKPCKFCKSDRELKPKVWNQINHWILCEGCGQIGPSKPTTQEAAEAWDTEQTPHVPVYG